MRTICVCIMLAFASLAGAANWDLVASPHRCGNRRCQCSTCFCEDRCVCGQLVNDSKAKYRAARAAAIMSGESEYVSDGKNGDPLPAGKYRLVFDRAKADIFYEDNAPPAMVNHPSSMFTPGCVGQS